MQPKTNAELWAEIQALQPRAKSQASENQRRDAPQAASPPPSDDRAPPAEAEAPISPIALRPPALSAPPPAVPSGSAPIPAIPATAQESRVSKGAAPTNASAPREDDAKVIARLAAMTPMEYDRLRKESAKQLGVSVNVLDAAVKSVRNKAAGADRLPFHDPVPWDEPVDPAALLDDIASTLLRFIVMDREEADADALWTVQTYVSELFEHSPINLITAAERECAKSLKQSVLKLVCNRPLAAANASPAAIFRAVEKWRPTLFIDEADTFFRDNPELHGLVNAGHHREGVVLRCEPSGDSFEPQAFSVYGPKCIAGIGLDRHLPDSTWSRGIASTLRRKLPHEKVERLRDADPADFDRLRSKIARFAKDNEQQLRSARPKMPDALSDRAQDNWHPLFAIAECAGQAWVDRATAAALKLSGTSEAQASIGNQLLADIQSVLANWKSDKISTADLLTALTADDEGPWPTYNRGKPITPRQIARLLEPYGIKSKTVRLGEKNTPKGFERAQFDDAFARYLQQAETPPPQRNDPVAPPPEPQSDVDADTGDWPDL
jgi:hypothetical protein